MFSHPFYLEMGETLYAPGTYEVEIIEKLIGALSFPAYRKVRCCIAVPTRRGISAGRQIIEVETRVLDEALARDANRTQRGTATDEICADYRTSHSGPGGTGPDHPLPPRVVSVGHRREAVKTNFDGFRSFFSGLNLLSGLVLVKRGRGRP
jgi:hypothetical protein